MVVVTYAGRAFASKIVMLCSHFLLSRLFHAVFSRALGLADLFLWHHVLSCQISSPQSVTVEHHQWLTQSRRLLQLHRALKFLQAAALSVGKECAFPDQTRFSSFHPSRLFHAISFKKPDSVELFLSHNVLCCLLWSVHVSATWLVSYPQVLQSSLRPPRLWCLQPTLQWLL